MICRQRRGTQRAFTLIELLVVVAIISLLISILLPSLSAAREQAKIVKCGSQLRDLGIAVQSCRTDNKDFGPTWDDGELVRTTGGAKPIMYTWVDVLFDLDYTGDFRVGVCPSDNRPDEVMRIRGENWNFWFTRNPGKGEEPEPGVRTSFAMNAKMHGNFKKDRFDRDPTRQVFAVDGWWNWFSSYNALWIWTDVLYGRPQDPFSWGSDQFMNMVGWRHGSRYQANTLFNDGHVSLVTPQPPKTPDDVRNFKDGTDTTKYFTWLPGEWSGRARDSRYQGDVSEYSSNGNFYPDMALAINPNPTPPPANRPPGAVWIGARGGDNVHPVGFPEQLSALRRTQANLWKKLPSNPMDRR